MAIPFKEPEKPLRIRSANEIRAIDRHFLKRDVPVSSANRRGVVRPDYLVGDLACVADAVVALDHFPEHFRHTGKSAGACSRHDIGEPLR